MTFDNYGLGPGFDRKGFGEDFLKASGISAVHVLGRGDDWYQYPDVFQALAAVRHALADADHVVAYGSSMGAYAALRFADAAGAHAVLAISPQFSIDPLRTPFEARWQGDARRIAFRPEIEQRLICSARPVIVYDAAGEDRHHVALIAAEIDCDLIGLRHIHHPATTFLLEAGLLGSLVIDMVADRIDVPALRRRAAIARKDSATCLTLMAERQPPHRPRTARGLAEKALRAAPDNPMALSSLGLHLSRAGEHEAAIALYERAASVSARAVSYLVPHGEALMAAGRIEEAIMIAGEVVEQMPTTPHFHFWKGLLHLCAGQLEPAIRAMESALALDPNDPCCRQTLEDVRARLRDAGQGLSPSATRPPG